jgi:hypothetical protein
MDTKEIMPLVLSSALIGAAFSALITWINMWRERVARERELLLTIAVDLSKTYMQRLSAVSKGIGTLPELIVLSGMHKILKDVFERGKVSKEGSSLMQQSVQES